MMLEICIITQHIVILKIKLRNSHKKWKDSLETRAKMAVLRSYVENQAMLEPTLLSG